MSCECEYPLVLNGATRCEVCGLPNQQVIHAVDKYRCSRCGEIMAMGQQAHNLKRHRFG